MKQIIASSRPFEGAPVLTGSSVYGASPKKPFQWRIGVLGERPVTVSVTGLPQGLTLQGQVVRGQVEAAGEYPVTVTAENARGKAQKQVTLKIAPDGMLQTPLMGYTSWNAYQYHVTQEDMIRVADTLVAEGFADYGYTYVNLDSSWQGEYGGKYDALTSCDRFPDLGAMYAHIHECGLKGGIYSTPYLHAWGAAPETILLGCTLPPMDIRFTDANTGIGTVHKEANNVRQWEEWGVDYLKYDWSPTDTINADLMKQELLKASREIAFCCTVCADRRYHRYWRANCCSWRDSLDSEDAFENILTRMQTVDAWKGLTAQGHFYDLDMLAIGAMIMNEGKGCRLSEQEELFACTLHAFVPSPIQISLELDKLTELERDLLCNEEVIAVNQDALCDYPVHVAEEKIQMPEGVIAYQRTLENGDLAVALFNPNEEEAKITLCMEKASTVRDLWAKENTAQGEKFTVSVEPHAAALYRISEI